MIDEREKTWKNFISVLRIFSIISLSFGGTIECAMGLVFAELLSIFEREQKM